MWAVLDTETSGRSSTQDRVLSLAVIILDANLKEVKRFSSLFSPGVDPGPTEIHGITSEMLLEAPTFAEKAHQIEELLVGKKIVAHNASFDVNFLQAEFERAGLAWDHPEPLCTVKLARRLQLETTNLKLGTLASHFLIKQHKAHDALDDTRVLVEIFRHLVKKAEEKQAPLYSAKTPAYRPRAAKVACPYPNPGRWESGEPLLKGMRVAFTGGDEHERESLEKETLKRGLDVSSSVSGKTSLLVSDGFKGSKAAKAETLGCPVVNFTLYRELLEALNV